jgi:hypothetical protein
MSEEHRYQHQCNADLATRAMLRQEGRELEQERIIKLLEPHRITTIKSLWSLKKRLRYLGFSAA